MIVYGTASNLNRFIILKCVNKILQHETPKSKSILYLISSLNLDSFLQFVRTDLLNLLDIDFYIILSGYHCHVCILKIGNFISKQKTYIQRKTMVIN